MTVTKDFQASVANRLTELFNYEFEKIMLHPSWRQINKDYKDLRNLDGQCMNYSCFLNVHKLPEEDNDVKNLFIIKKLLENEIKEVSELLPKEKKRPKLASVLECISESITKYYDNDGPGVIGEYRPGNPIYSPIVDLAITPSVRLQQNGKTHSLGNYPLSNGPIIFEALSRLTLIKRLKRHLETIAGNNLRRAGLQYRRDDINIRPLCLFAIEIENQINKKHMMGDFLNSLMLSKYPVVLVPNSKLNQCLELVKTAKVIFEIKRVNVYELLRKVMVLSIPQFRRVVDNLLIENQLERLSVVDFR